MSLQISNFDGHLVRLIGDMPVTFSWRGTDYQGAKTTPDVSQTLQLGGMEEAAALQLFVRRATLPSVPKIGDHITLDGEKYKVLSVRQSPDNGQLVSLTLGWSRLP